MGQEYRVDIGKNEMDKYLNKKQILEYLSDHSGEFSTYQDIADVTGLSKTTVGGLIMELLKGGYLGRRIASNPYWGFAYRIYSNELPEPNQVQSTKLTKEITNMSKRNRRLQKHSLASEIIKYVKENPNSTAVQISNALNREIKSVAASLSGITTRKLLYRQKVGKSFQYNAKKSGLQPQTAIQQPMVFATRKVMDKTNKVTFNFVDSMGNTVINFTGDTNNKEHISILKNIVAGLEQ